MEINHLLGWGGGGVVGGRTHLTLRKAPAKGIMGTLHI